MLFVFTISCFYKEYMNWCIHFTYHCSGCNAGSSVTENLSRIILFDIKAVFGSVCHHEVTQKFLDLNHGERQATMCRASALLNLLWYLH